MSRSSARRNHGNYSAFTPLRENKAFRIGATIVAILIVAALILSLVLPFAAGDASSRPLHGG